MKMLGLFLGAAQILHRGVGVNWSTCTFQNKPLFISRLKKMVPVFSSNLVQSHKKAVISSSPKFISSSCVIKL